MIHIIAVENHFFQKSLLLKRYLQLKSSIPYLQKCTFRSKYSTGVHTCSFIYIILNAINLRYSVYFDVVIGLLKIIHKDIAIMSFSFFDTLACILSGPGDLSVVKLSSFFVVISYVN